MEMQSKQDIRLPILLGVALIFVLSVLSSGWMWHKVHERTVIAKVPKVALLPLQSRTTQMQGTSRYDAVHVVTGAGKRVTLDVRKTPLFFFNYLFGMQDIAAFASEWGNFHAKPALIVTGWPSTISLKKAEQLTTQALALNELGEANVYYLSDSHPYGTYVSGLPDTYVWQKHVLYHVPGTLPRASDWLTVFNGGLK